ncbi:MAG: hypothetical protein COV45_03960 [Deltaproteobacteria bacterium CG11_big_fil_rev_8_21_14_0_20_47_16]|nr:MAG: hypothetical protein COV45_03960 [Deltaproteobacteria bacterium CG11_big_fil_rev_8_21_14_0_20_47_16]
MTTVVVGGGLAGLSAATALAQRGESVTLLESRSFCGGRAYSYNAPVVGDIVDNGQHVMLGCYTATRQYVSLIGSSANLIIQPQLAIPMVSSADTQQWFRCPQLPSPLNLVVGLARFCGWQQAWRLVQQRHVLQQDPSKKYINWDQLSCAEWFKSVGISNDAIHRFWEPLTLAVMNDSPGRVSAAPFLSALHRIVTGPRNAASLAISRVGLSDLLVNPAIEFLKSKGSEVRSGVTISRVVVQDQKITSLVSNAGETFIADKVIFAMPPAALSKTLSETPGTIVLREMLSCFETSPILSVYLWYDRPVVDQPIVGLLNSPFHWMFSRHAILGGNAPYGVTLVVSGAADFDKMNRDDVVEMALKAMQEFFPKSRGAQLVHRMVSREPHATVRLAPGTQRLRAAIKSPWSNAQFVGDWTDTQLPATIEGAIASGIIGSAT